MHALEKEMATHSSVIAWRIPGTEEPGGLLSMGVAKATKEARLMERKVCFISDAGNWWGG